jgi:DNA polymerase II small subunit
MELDEKKKKIINLFLKKGILLDSKILERLENPEFVNKLHKYISEKADKDLMILSDDIIDYLDKNLRNVNWVEFEKSKAILEKKGQDKSYKTFISQVLEDDCFKNPVNVIFSYSKPSKKREVQNFISYFNHRYNSLKSILQNRKELQNSVSIKRLLSKSGKEEVSLIGIVLDKAVTKNMNIMLTLEDPTGAIKVYVGKNKGELYSLAKDIMLDEVIGVTGMTGDKIVFANNLLLPDVPVSKELKKSPEEGYAIFVGDQHFGSKSFLRENFDKFIKWVNGEIGSEEQKKISKKIKYIFIVGDLVDGVGIYPNHHKDLEIQDIYDQYDVLAAELKKIPQHIKLIVCPGNHDAMRIAEPQPPLYEDFAAAFYKLPNVISVSNPALVNIDKSESFPGFDVLLYHGYSFPYYAFEVESIRANGSQKRADLVMKYVLQRRHLAPTHSSNLYIPDPDEDPLVIDKVPDFFVTGHIHRATVSSYRNITLLNCSTWVGKTDYQEKIGLEPEPARAIIVNLQTREAKIIKF